MILLDTNILLRLVDAPAQDHPAAVASINTLQTNQETLVFVPQVAYEF